MKRATYYGLDPKQVSSSEIPDLLAVIDSLSRIRTHAEMLARTVWTWSCLETEDPERVAEAEERIMSAYFAYKEQVKSDGCEYVNGDER